MKNLSADLGEIIRERRLAAGISQEELAARAAIHRTYVSQLERGLKSPTVAILAKVANALGTSPSRLLRGIEGPEEQ